MPVDGQSDDVTHVAPPYHTGATSGWIKYGVDEAFETVTVFPSSLTTSSNPRRDPPAGRR